MTITNPSFEARSNSVKQLCDLHRVVVAISVGLAFQNVIDVKAQPIPIKPDYIITFLALIVTVIPFFHGAVRHLFATYIESADSARIRNWAILVDFYLLLLEGGLFVALATMLGVTSSFVMILAIVLAVDCVWGLLASIGFAGGDSQEAEIKWAAINFPAVVLFVLLYIFYPVLLNIGLSDGNIQVLVLVITVVRTAVDYRKNYKFYFP